MQMNVEQYTTESESGTVHAGRALAGTLAAGDVVALTGDLGAGKTVFTRGIAEGLGSRDDVTSPTFTLIHEYEGRLLLYHMDLYRLESEEEMQRIGIEEYLYGNGVCVIEWAEKLGALAPADMITVSICHTGSGTRTIQIERSVRYDR